MTLDDKFALRVRFNNGEWIEVLMADAESAESAAAWLERAMTPRIGMFASAAPVTVVGLAHTYTFNPRYVTAVSVICLETERHLRVAIARRNVQIEQESKMQTVGFRQ